MNRLFTSPETIRRSRRARRLRRALLLCSAGALCSGHPGYSATQTWLGDSGNGGPGTWSTPTDWSPTTWVAGNVGIFGGTVGTGLVTVGTQTASGLTFNASGYTLQSGTLTLDTGSVITTMAGTTTFASTLNLAGAAGVALTKTGAGTLALSTSNGSLGTAANPAVWTITGGTYSGTTGTFNSILSIGAGNNLGATPSSATTQVILDSGTLQVTGTGLNPAIGAARTIQVNAAGGAIVDSTGNPFAGAIVDNAGSGSSLYLSNASGTTTISGIISSTGGLTWNGAGTLTLSGTNSYSGGTTINGGTVSFATNANLGASSGAVNLSGGTLSLSTGSLSGSASAVFAHNLATGTLGGTIDVASGAVLALNYFNQNATGNITGSGPLTKTSAGQLVLSGNNSGYSGNWTINAGLLEVQYNGSTSVGTGSVTLAAGTELALNYGNTISNAISSAGGTISYAVGGNGTYSGAISLTAGTTTVGLRDFYNAGNAESGSVTGVISGAGALATAGGGVLTVSGTNTYSGGTTINSGTVSFSSNANLGANSGAVNLGGGTLSDTGNLNGSASAVFAHNIATGTVGGTINVATGDVLGLNYFGNNATGNITGSGPLTKTGTGQLILSGSNGGYSGNWTIGAGLVEVQNNGSTSLGSGSVALAAGTEIALDYGNTISNPITSTGGTISFANFGGGTYSAAVTLNSGTTTVGLRDFYSTSNAESGSITGVISGTGGLATSGGGTLTLSKANTYTGATNVDAGTLLLSTGSINGSLTVTVTNTGALTLQNSTALNDSGTLSLSTGANLNLDAASGSSEVIGSLILNGTTEPAGIYSASALAGLSSASGIMFESMNGETLTVGTVPEPSTWVAGSLLVMVAVGRTYRRARGR